MNGECFCDDPAYELGCPYWNPDEFVCEVPCDEACPWYPDNVILRLDR